MRNCRTCGVTKPVADFYAAKSNRDGIQNECKACLLARGARYRKANSTKAMGKLELHATLPNGTEQRVTIDQCDDPTDVAAALTALRREIVRELFCTELKSPDFEKKGIDERVLGQLPRGAFYNT